MDVTYHMYTLYPDIIENEYSILVNKEIQYNRDRNLLSYLNDRNVPKFPMNQEEFNSSYSVLLNYIFDTSLNIHNIQIILVMCFEDSEIMALCVNNNKNKRYKNFNDAVVDLTNKFSRS